MYKSCDEFYVRKRYRRLWLKIRVGTWYKLVSREGCLGVRINITHVKGNVERRELLDW